MKNFTSILCAAFFATASLQAEKSFPIAIPNEECHHGVVTIPKGWEVSVSEDRPREFILTQGKNKLRLNVSFIKNARHNNPVYETQRTQFDTELWKRYLSRVVSDMFEPLTEKGFGETLEIPEGFKALPKIVSAHNYYRIKPEKKLAQTVSCLELEDFLVFYTLGLIGETEKFQEITKQVSNHIQIVPVKH